MILWLTILIDLCLIFAVFYSRRKDDAFHRSGSWKFVSRARKDMFDRYQHFSKRDRAYFRGVVAQLEIKAAIAEKFSERAFNMASTANLGVIALQKSLQLPRLPTKQVLERNQLAKNQVDKLFNGQGKFDYLWPILDDDQRQVIEDMEKQALKEQET